MAIPSIDVSGFGDFRGGLQSGGNLLQQIMQPIMQQRGMNQADIHHKNNLGFKMQQLEQQGLQHKQNLGIALEQLEMAKALQPWKVKEAAAKVAYHQAQAQDLANTQNLISQFMGQGGGMQPPQQMPQVSAPGQEQIQQGFSAPPAQNAIANMNPALAGLFKKKTGIDPYAESPQMKSERAFGDFVKKEQFKQGQKEGLDLTTITPATRTKYQDVIREVNSIMPVMNELVEGGGENITGFGTAGDLKYLGKIKRIADVYMKAKNWPNTDKARNDAIQLFKKGWSESAAQYKSRMQELQTELNEESKLATIALKSGKSRPSQDIGKVKPVNKMSLAEIEAELAGGQD